MRPFIRLRVLCLTLLALSLGCSDRDRNMAINAMNNGIAQYNRGNYGGAVSRLEEATRIDPSYGEPYLYMGMIRLRHYNSPETALPDLERAAERMPDDPRAFFLLGTAFLEIGLRRQGEDALERALALDPSHYEAWLSLAQYHETNGNIQAAIQMFTQSIYTNHRSFLGYLGLGDIYARYGYWSEAVAVYQNGYDNSGAPELLAALGTAYLQEGNLEAAIEIFERAVAHDNRSIVNRYNLGVAYVRSFELTNDPRDRQAALEHLNLAHGRCGALGSQARCNQVGLMIRQLEASTNR